MIQLPQNSFHGRLICQKQEMILCNPAAQKDPAVRLHGSGQPVQHSVPFFIAITAVVSLEAVQIQEYDHCVLCSLRCHHIQRVVRLLRKPVQTV